MMRQIAFIPFITFCLTQLHIAINRYVLLRSWHMQLFAQHHMPIIWQIGEKCTYNDQMVCLQCLVIISKCLPISDSDMWQILISDICKMFGKHFNRTFANCFTPKCMPNVYLNCAVIHSIHPLFVYYKRKDVYPTSFIVWRTT